MLQNLSIRKSVPLRLKARDCFPNRVVLRNQNTEKFRSSKQKTARREQLSNTQLSEKYAGNSKSK